MTVKNVFVGVITDVACCGGSCGIIVCTEEHQTITTDSRENTFFCATSVVAAALLREYPNHYTCIGTSLFLTFQLKHDHLSLTVFCK